MLRILYAIPLIVFSLLFIPGQLFAAINAADLPEIHRQQERIIQQQEERIRMQEEELRRKSERPLGALEPDLLPHVQSQEGAACMEIAEIIVNGATVFSQEQLWKIMQQYMHRCLTIADINNLLRDITNLYIEHGYVTSRAFVAPEQNSPGVLHVLVIEGRIEKIIFNNDEFGGEYRVLFAFPSSSGDLLNLRDIEQGIDQLNRLQSNNATTELEPGETLGGTVIKVTNPPARTWVAGFGLDNLGQHSTGKTQYSLSFSKDNFIGLGDQISIYWSEDLRSGERDQLTGKRKGGHNDSLSFYLSIPFGYWTFSANANQTTYTSTIAGINTSYSSRGSTDAYLLQLDRVVHRDADSKSSVGVSINTRDVRNYINDVRLGVSSYVLTSGQISFSHNRRIWGGIATAALHYSRGLPWLGALRDKDKSGPRKEFDKYSLSASFYRPFSFGEERLYWKGSVYGQYSPHTLYSSERVAIGGRNSARGFHADSISGDTGGYLRNEIGWNIPWFESLKDSSTVGGLQLYAAYDFGSLYRDRKDPFERGTMQGIALGLRAIGDLSLDLCISKALAAPDFIKKPENEFYFSLHYAF